MKKNCITVSDSSLNGLKESLLKRYARHEREPEFNIVLGLDKNLPRNGFQIKRTGEQVSVSAYDLASLYCGAGTVLHGDVRENGFHAMQKPFRAVYFATHFDNWFCRASKEELDEYITDMALWGFNILVFWHDMHHFDSWNAPEAKAHRALLFFLAECARKCGLQVCSLHLANEGAMDIPAKYRAYKKPGIYSRGSWYDSQICPSNPEGMAELKKHYQTVIDDFLVPLRPDHVILWPYDQGGCQCPDCMPWGGNGFVKASAAFAAQLRNTIPGCSVILATWFMDNEELAMLIEAVRSGVLPCNYLTIEQSHRSSETPLPEPDDIPIIGFPDISMRMTPWGGYGMDPQPAALQEEWDDCKAKRAGGYLYSEGIFDDISKVIYSQFYCWDRTAMESVRLYGTYECGSGFAEKFAEMVRLMEVNSLAARLVPAAKMREIHEKLFREYPSPSISRVIHTLYSNKVESCWQYVMAKKVNDFEFHDAGTALEICREIDTALPESVRRSPRWRLIRARVELDAIMSEEHGDITPRCYPWLQEVIDTSYVTENTIRMLRPLLPELTAKAQAKSSQGVQA